MANCPLECSWQDFVWADFRALRQPILPKWNPKCLPTDAVRIFHSPLPCLQPTGVFLSATIRQRLFRRRQSPGTRRHRLGYRWLRHYEQKFLIYWPRRPPNGPRRAGLRTSSKWTSLQNQVQQRVGQFVGQPSMASRKRSCSECRAQISMFVGEAHWTCALK